MKNPYDLLHSSSLNYSTNFNLLFNYYEKFKKQPFLFFSSISIETNIVKKFEELNFKKIFVSFTETKDDEETKIFQNEVVYEYNECYVLVSFNKPKKFSYLEEDEEEDDDDASCKYKILYQNEEELNFIRSLMNSVKEKKDESKVNLIVREHGELFLKKFKLNCPEDVDIELHYGKELKNKLDKLIENINTKKSGIVLFSGLPGTGKSTLIKILSKKIKRKIIYLPSTAAEELSEPSFINFIMDHKSCILLLEDAEKVLRSRELTDNSAMSNILNITDGLLGDCLNVMIIATFNTNKDEIDPALTRKGRLILEHEFDKLPTENCNKIFKKNKINRKTKEPMSLAEIFNEESNYHEEKANKKIGFK